MAHSDDWIEDRIRFKADKCSVPSSRTSFFADADEETRLTVDSHLLASHGRPVLLAFDSPDRWSVIATRQFVGLHEARPVACSYADISSMTSRDYPPKHWVDIPFRKIGDLKLAWDFLRVTLSDESQLDFWVPPGEDAFTFWNIVLMLSRMAAPPHG